MFKNFHFVIDTDGNIQAVLKDRSLATDIAGKSGWTVTDYNDSRVKSQLRELETAD